MGPGGVVWDAPAPPAPQWCRVVERTPAPHPLPQTPQTRAHGLGMGQKCTSVGHPRRMAHNTPPPRPPPPPAQRHGRVHGSGACQPRVFSLSKAMAGHAAQAYGPAARAPNPSSETQAMSARRGGHPVDQSRPFVSAHTSVGVRGRWWVRGRVSQPRCSPARRPVRAAFMRGTGGCGPVTEWKGQTRCTRSAGTPPPPRPKVFWLTRGNSQCPLLI